MSSSHEAVATLQQCKSTESTGTDEEQGIPLRAMRSDSYPTNSHTRADSSDRLSERSRSVFSQRHHFHLDREGIAHFKDRFLGHGRRPVSVRDSLINIARSSWLNVFLLFIPFSWVAHFSRSFEHPWAEGLIFSLCFISIIPLENLFDYGGEQMALYLGMDLGDLLIVTLNNAVEATLAIILLRRCEIRLLQSTIVGVIVLHLLLIPGTAFITGGAQTWEQNLHPHLSQLNQSLLTVGVLALVLPAAFFAALERGSSEDLASVIVNDESRDMFLRISRGLAVMLLIIYICSRIFIHNPPGEDNAGRPHPLAPEEVIKREKELAEEDPEVKSWVCIIMLAVAIALMATTAEFLVESIEFVREQSSIQDEWFGLILLPFVSFAADGTVAIGYFLRYALRVFLGAPKTPTTLAKAIAIDLSVQFALFWMPFITLLGWWTNKPMTLLFDFYEVAVIIAACFLVNYVTADAKTNWAEGVTMVSFYIMIALTTWYYSGQPEIRAMTACTSVADALFGSGGSE